jgi:hypothetical protein
MLGRGGGRRLFSITAAFWRSEDARSGNAAEIRIDTYWNGRGISWQKN